MSELKKFAPNFTTYGKEKYAIWNRLKGNPDFVRFCNWCENIKVKTKDYGIIPFSPNRWTLLQWMIVEALFSDAETVMVLKPRQAGGTTICLAYDLYKAFTIQNLQGVIAGADYEQVRTPMFLLRQLYGLIPPNLKVSKVEANSFRIRFVNGNFFEFRYPSLKLMKMGRMARGTAVNFAHITEAAYFVNEEDLNTLEAAFSTHYPHRKYIYETTANGYNYFYERWMANKENPTARLIFGGWWARDDYALVDPRELEFYRKPIFEWEEQKVREIAERYGVEITYPQLAWWRKQVKARFRNDEAMALQEFPWTEEDAFAAKAHSTFEQSVEALHGSLGPPRECYQVVFGQKWHEMQLYQSSLGALKIWIPWARRNPYATYIIGVDPAFSVNRESHNACIQILECYKDKIYQAAEFAMNTIDVQRLAFLTLYLAAKYDAVINYEVQGGGQGFVAFLQNIKQYANSQPDPGPMLSEIKKANFREYVYRRRDTIGYGAAKGVLTTADLKKRMFLSLQSYIENGQLVIRSRALHEELKNISVEDGEFFKKTRSKADDRVMALLIALIAYQDVSPAILLEEEKAIEKQEKNEDPEKTKAERFSIHFFRSHIPDWARTFGVRG